MLDIANYLAKELLRDGRSIHIRALGPSDKTEMIAAVGRTSDKSLYRRFFAAKRDFTEQEIIFFLQPDFETHIGLVATGEEDGRQVIIGGGRYIVVQPGRAELAFVVIDQYQGQGIGSILLKHLVVIARAREVSELIAEVLPENASMLKVFQNSGVPVTTKRDAGVVHVALRL
jgi:GNAT superfamily N-acetyltransferase